MALKPAGDGAVTTGCPDLHEMFRLRPPASYGIQRYGVRGRLGSHPAVRSSTVFQHGFGPHALSSRRSFRPSLGGKPQRSAPVSVVDRKELPEPG